jgi:hypothetical protein
MEGGTDDEAKSQGDGSNVKDEALGVPRVDLSPIPGMVPDGSAFPERAVSAEYTKAVAAEVLASAAKDRGETRDAQPAGSDAL